MTINYSLLTYILLGIIMITLLDSLGAIASRKFNFKYVLLTPVSIIIYILTSCLISKENSLNITLLCNSLIGMFDATAGWYLSMVLKANTGLTQEQLAHITVQQRALMMVIFAVVFGCIGHIIAN